MSSSTSSHSRTRIGKYELGKTLGEGSFAKVKFARNLETGHNFAIKILDKGNLLKHKMIGQIKREISTMKLIRHPNVIRMFEVMASKTKIYIVLEFVTGGELFDKIARNGRLKEDEARKYFQQLVNAVDYCHSRGVSHRDLKPENLLLDVNGALKVSDFGLSALPQQVRDTIYQEHTISRDQVAEVVVEALVCEESLYKVVEIGTLPDAPSTLNQGSLCFNRATISLLDPP